MEEHIQRIWKKYLNNTASNDELKVLLEVLSNSANSHLVTSLLQQQWDKPFAVVIDSNNKKKLVLEKLQKTIGASQPKENHTAKWFTVAAAIMALIGLGVVLYIGTTGGFSNYTEFTVAQTEAPKTITLPDGSTIVVNSGATLGYAKKFSKNRAVKLQGEAFFKVAKDSMHPFIIQTGELYTRVVGTQFNVHENAASVSVTVTEGKVRVYTKKDTVNVTANEQAVYQLQTNSLTEKQVNASLYSLWQTEQVTLNLVPMREFAVVLQELYQQQVVFKDEAAKEVLLSISFRAQEDISAVINRVNLINEVTLTLKPNHMITIEKN